MKKTIEFTMIYAEDDEEIKILFNLGRAKDLLLPADEMFVEKVYEFFEEKEFITDKQYDTLLKIYHKNCLGDSK